MDGSIISGLIGGSLILVPNLIIVGIAWGRLTQRVKNIEDNAVIEKADRKEANGIIGSGSCMLEECRQEFKNTASLIGELNGKMDMIIGELRGLKK